jgi:hypothetical protein
MGDFAVRNDAITSEFNSAQLKSVDDVHCLGTAKTVDGYSQVYPNTADKPIPVALQTVGNVGDSIFKGHGFRDGRLRRQLGHLGQRALRQLPAWIVTER